MTDLSVTIATPAPLTVSVDGAAPVTVQTGAPEVVTVLPALIAGPPGLSEAALSMTAAVTLSGHRAVVLTSAGADYADRTNPMHARAAIGVTAGAATAGEPVTVRLGGVMDEPSWDWALNAPIYLGTAGLLTQVFPASGFACQLAWAVTATRIVIDPREPIALT